MANGLAMFAPDGHEFQTREEAVLGLSEELRRTNEVVEEERQRRIEEARRAELLAAKLRELGVNPDDVLRPAG